MDDLLAVFAIEDALHEFRYSDLYSASYALLRAMNYPIKYNRNNANQTIENLIYFTSQNKAHYSSQEMIYLKHIESVSFLGELRSHDLLGIDDHLDDSIVFLSIETTSLLKERTEDSYYISQILSKTFNGFVILIIKNTDYFMFSSYMDDQDPFLSDWYNLKATHMDLIPLLALCNHNICGTQNVKEYYYELIYGFSRDYIKYQESYEYVTYEIPSYIEFDSEEGFASKQQLKEITEHNINYYKERYGYDYVAPDNSFKVLAEEDDEWILMELDGFIMPVDEIEEEMEVYGEEDDDVDPFDYSEIVEETLNDPVELLKWLEQRDNQI